MFFQRLELGEHSSLDKCAPSGRMKKRNLLAVGRGVFFPICKKKHSFFLWGVELFEPGYKFKFLQAAYREEWLLGLQLGAQFDSTRATAAGLRLNKYEFVWALVRFSVHIPQM